MTTFQRTTPTAQSGGHPSFVKRGAQDNAAPPNPFDRMELVIDDYGKERFVESRYENGKLRVWYQYRSDGALLRYEHRGFGSSSELADPAVFGKYAKNGKTADASAAVLDS